MGKNAPRPLIKYLCAYLKGIDSEYSDKITLLAPELFNL